MSLLDAQGNSIQEKKNLIFKVQVYGSSFLDKEISKEVVILEAAIEDISLMESFLKFFPVKGITAPQLGIEKRILTMRLVDGGMLTMINPRLEDLGLEKIINVEGCISLPGIAGVPIERSTEVTATFYDKNFDVRKAVFTGVEAVILQHEYDHLSGIFISDKVDGAYHQGWIKSRMKKVHRRFKGNDFIMEIKIDERLLERDNQSVPKILPKDWGK